MNDPSACASGRRKTVALPWGSGKLTFASSREVFLSLSPPVPELASFDWDKSSPPDREKPGINPLPTGPSQDLAAVHRAVAQLRRRLATQGHEKRGRRRTAVVDVLRTMRASASDAR